LKAAFFDESSAAIWRDSWAGTEPAMIDLEAAVGFAVVGFLSEVEGQK
jgi:hypothetical protein